MDHLQWVRPSPHGPRPLVTQFKVVQTRISNFLAHTAISNRKHRGLGSPHADLANPTHC